MNIRNQIPSILLINALKSDKAHAEIAFKIIYDLYFIPLNKLASRMLKEEEEAKDIVQDTFITLWNGRLFLIIPGNNIEIYLIHIVKNKCIDILRKRKTKEKYINYLQATVKTFSNNNPLENKELAFYMQQAILALPQKQFEIFTLQSLYGIKQKDIATLLSIQLQNEKNNMSVTLKILRLKLKHFLR